MLKKLKNIFIVSGDFIFEIIWGALLLAWEEKLPKTDMTLKYYYKYYVEWPIEKSVICFIIPTFGTGKIIAEGKQ